MNNKHILFLRLAGSLQPPPFLSNPRREKHTICVRNFLQQFEGKSKKPQVSRRSKNKKESHLVNSWSGILVQWRTAKNLTIFFDIFDHFDLKVFPICTEMIGIRVGVGFWGWKCDHTPPPHCLCSMEHCLDWTQLEPRSIPIGVCVLSAGTPKHIATPLAFGVG